MTDLLELREYQIKPGQLDAFLQLMRDTILPYQRAQVMEVVFTSHWCDEQGQDWFVWQRRYRDEAHRQQLFEQVYNDWWIEHIRPQVFELIEADTVRVRLLTPTAF
ncbi:hypothetical protein CHH28_03080 [Bacterioplanes sanyensis]|uniref:NIPSNAP domain-containing protein n=1 Tax=Bacterioplanes sanyensis TaxID=1249553 RepID=A0A222FGJ6_9GAMM|nr:NIPSNAP family protein [Bacterioplanes sanyensis]ASP37716.1 hypothetical protein CHH28_03080 [Bacterioplanes sanyensis]